MAAATMEATHQERLPGGQLSEREAAGVATIFSLLGDPTRVRVLAALAEAPEGERCVGDLAQLVERDESTISHQLRLLRGHGLVEFRRAGRTVYYRLADGHVLDLFHQALAHARHTLPTRASGEVH